MNRTHPYTALALIAAATTFAGRSDAVQQPTHLPHGLELADATTTARAVRTHTTHVPKVQAANWRAFRHDIAGSWVASWDEGTAVPNRIWGTGVAAPGVIKSADAALQFSRDMLARHLSLLAPGASLDDFELASNLVHRGQRVVAFLQKKNGMRVLGGQLSFRFRNDRLTVMASDALPHVPALGASIEVSQSTIDKAALGWIQKDFGPDAKITERQGPFVLPIVTKGSVMGYRAVSRVTVELTSPQARFDVFVDIADGAPVAREQTLHFATGQVLYNAPVRYPLSDRQNYPAAEAFVTVEGQAAAVDLNGNVAFANATTQIETSVSSPRTTVNNLLGAEVAASLPLSDGGTAIWNVSADADDDAQLTGFIHTQLIKDYAKAIAPEMQWIDANLPVNVNGNDQCNAFYDGSSINFYRQSNNCENTGRLADVVYHEFGHGFHHHAVILGSGQFESALSEGASDFIAATYTGDPGMGRGFFYSNAPLRHIDPPSPNQWPDDITEDPHGTGLIIGGALWDLRELLVAKYGELAGVTLVNQLYYDALRNASDIPSMYVEVLAADDDDGNLENGTPNVCEIVQAFGLHGLRTFNAVPSELSVEPPTQIDHQVSLTIEGLFEQCPGDAVQNAVVYWRLEGADSFNDVTMGGGPSVFTAEIPAQADGSVVRYVVEANLGTAQLSFPDNLADPSYQFFVGEVTPIYCTDFETDPAEDGWTHQLIAGEPDEGADDWQWDTPNGNSQNGDPGEAYSGDYVFGNDLGHDNFNGLYQGDKINAADSPVIDVSGYDNVRLQYRRWLNIEDGFYDQGRIYANGQEVWSNLSSSSMNGADVHHTDREWRFHDVDLTDQIGDDGTVQIRFEIQSDQGLHFGGWTIDDFCVVAYEASDPVDPVCGNGTVEVGEDCDDGNTQSGDGCSAICDDEGDNPIDEGEEDPTEPSGLKVADSGCGCRVTGIPTRERGLPLAILALGLAGASLRRRRRG